MDQEHKETIERTIVELESQQMAVQQLVTEALSDLELLYGEIEEQARLIEEAGPSEVDHEHDVTGEAKEELEALQQDIASLQEERQELESQLRQLRQELEAAPLAAVSNADDPKSSETPSQRPASALLGSAPVPNSAAIHAPFERLREHLGGL